ncbi:MAG: putative nucleotide-diphospho-sugar transferase [Rubricella sp.]
MAEPGRGVIFVATGAGYLELATRAAGTVRACMPDIPIDLFTDQDAVAGDPFDAIHRVEGGDPRIRISCMAETRFDRTLMMDADTWMVQPVQDVFDLLDRFDLALAHDPDRVSPRAMAEAAAGIPEAFPEFNGGIIAWRRNAATDRFLRDWKAAYDAQGGPPDQVPLRRVLWQSDLRIATLPQEYNLFQLNLIDAFSRMNASPKIIHSFRLHQHLRGHDRIETLEQLLGPRRFAKLQTLVRHRRRMVRRAGRS